MKKFTKYLALAAALCVGAIGIGVMSACSESERTYTMEAEYSDFGDSVSNWQSVGFGLIGQDNRYSGGYKVQCLSTREGNIITWTFDSSVKTEATLELLVITGGAYGAASTLTDDGVDIMVNGEKQSFEDIDLIEENNAENLDPRGTISIGINLNEGTNVITYAISDSTYAGTTVGADIDCIKITAKSTLTWTDHTENLEKHFVGYEG